MRVESFINHTYFAHTHTLSLHIDLLVLIMVILQSKSNISENHIIRHCRHEHQPISHILTVFYYMQTVIQTCPWSLNVSTELTRSSRTWLLEFKTVDIMLRNLTSTPLGGIGITEQNDLKNKSYPYADAFMGRPRYILYVGNSLSVSDVKHRSSMTYRWWVVTDDHHRFSLLSLSQGNARISYWS